MSLILLDTRYLVVSLGSIGRRHLRNLRMLRPDSCIAVLRLTTNRVQDDLLEDADLQLSSVGDALQFAPTAAIIASPASTHLQIALPLVRAGIPLLIEKPLATSSLGLSELIHAAFNTPVMVGYNLRFLNSLADARNLILDGVIGDVFAVRAEVGQYLPEWRQDIKYQDTVSAQLSLGGGALLELSHEFDYLYWFFGLPTCLSATGGKYSALEIDVEDLVSVNLNYESPFRLVHVHLDFLQRVPSRCCKFIGSEGTIFWDGITDTLKIYKPAVGKWSFIETRPCLDRNETYVTELAYFLECVANWSTPIPNLRSACDVLAIVDATRESMSSQCRVKVMKYDQF